MRNVPVPPNPGGPAAGTRHAVHDADPRPPDAPGPRESIGDLISDVTRDLATLMRQEIALTRAELKQEAVETGRSAATIGGAGLAAAYTALFLSLALWAGLSATMRPAWAALAVAAVWAVISSSLYVTGRARSRRIDPRPTITAETLRQVPDALKGHRGGTP
jgi:hypothetical protein